MNALVRKGGGDLLSQFKQMELDLEELKIDKRFIHFFSDMVFSGKAKKISGDGIFILLIMKVLANWDTGAVKVSLDELIDYSGYGKSHIRDIIKRLVENKFISKKPRHGRSKTEYEIKDIIQARDENNSVDLSIPYQPRNLRKQQQALQDLLDGQSSGYTGGITLIIQTTDNSQNITQNIGTQINIGTEAAEGIIEAIKLFQTNPETTQRIISMAKEARRREEEK